MMMILEDLQVPLTQSSNAAIASIYTETEIGSV
jgi:hypothetical protein